MSIAATEEYNSFGPWVAPVRGPEDVPPLFAAHPIDFAGAAQILKFPRPESRRDLLAGMNLYDYLVIVAPTTVTVLRRQGDSYETGTFALRELATISSGADLLDGHLTMTFVGGESYQVPYNGSSSDAMLRLVDTIRSLLGPGVARRLTALPIRMPLGMDELGRDDVGFSNAANDLPAAGMSVLAASGRRVVSPNPSLINELRHRFAPTTLHGSVVAIVGPELVVLSRVRWLTNGRAPDLSMRRTIVRMDRVDSVSRQPHSRFPGVAVVTLASGSARWELLVPADAPIAEALGQLPSL